MAVYKSSLPVRHENIGDLTITLAGSDNTTILDVLTVNSAFGATPNGIPLLGKYEITPTAYDDGDAVPILVDASGKIQADVEVVLPETMDVNVTNGAGAAAVNIQDGGNTITVDAIDLDIRDIVYTQDSIQIWSNTQSDGGGTDLIPIVDASGRLLVNIGAGGSQSEKVDDSAFAVASDYVGVVGYLYDDTATDLVDEGDVGVPRMTSDRIALSILDDGTNRLSVLNDGDAYNANTGGILVLGQNAATDYQALKVDASGALYVNTGSAGSLVEVPGSANCIKDTPVTVVTLTPTASVEVLGVTYAGSGKAQVDIYYGTTSSEIRKHTFYTSASDPNIDHTFPAEVPLDSSQTIYVEVTNLEKVASPQSDFTGYATISYTPA